MREPGEDFRVLTGSEQGTQAEQPPIKKWKK